MAKPSPKLRVRRGHDRDGELDADELRRRVEGIVRVYQDAHLPRACRNERWLHGDQWNDDDIDASNDDVIDRWDDRVPRVHHNLLRNHALTWTARAIEMKPHGRVYPKANASMMVAEVCNRILEHYFSKLEWDYKLQRATLQALPQSCAGFKVYWDPDVGDEDDWEGDLAMDVVTVEEYGTDGAQNVADSKWVYFTRSIDKHDAYDYLIEAGYSKDEAHRATLSSNPESTNDDSMLSMLTGMENADLGQVQACELWWRPGSLFENGLVLMWIGDKLVLKRDKEYPFDHRQTPLSVLKVMDRDGSPYGSTHFDDAVPIQRMYNELLSVMAKRFWDFRHSWVVGDSDIIDQIRASDVLLKRKPPAPGMQGKRALEVVETNPHPDYFDRIEASLREKMADCWGLTEQLSAGTVDPHTAGKTVAFVNQLARMKLKEYLEQVQMCVKRVSLQMLQIVQQMMDVDRVVDIVGPGAELAVIEFLEADLDEYDVKFETVAGDMFNRAARGAEAQQQALEGLRDPAEAMAITDTGLSISAPEELQRTLIREAAGAVLEGQPAQPDPRVTPDVAIPELHSIIQMSRDNPYVDGVEMMLDFYMQQPPAMQPPQQGAPPQPGAAPEPVPVGPGGIPLSGNEVIQ
jgi:hypothetical protein